MLTIESPGLTSHYPMICYYEELLGCTPNNHVASSRFVASLESGSDVAKKIRCSLRQPGLMVLMCRRNEEGMKGRRSYVPYEMEASKPVGYLPSSELVHYKKASA